MAIKPNSCAGVHGIVHVEVTLTVKVLELRHVWRAWGLIGLSLRMLLMWLLLLGVLVLRERWATAVAESCVCRVLLLLELCRRV
jgi:hypothetical protein